MTFLKLQGQFELQMWSDKAENYFCRKTIFVELPLAHETLDKKFEQIVFIS